MTTADAPLLMRLLAKVLLDILPAVIASVIGGLLFTHYQLGGLGVPAAAALSAPANAEMMQLLRDEHAVIVDYLKAQLAAEKSRAAEQDREMRAAAAEAAEPAPPAVTLVLPLPAPSPRRWRRYCWVSPRSLSACRRSIAASSAGTPPKRMRPS